MKTFKGRKTELAILQKKFDLNEFQMVILYGRRRIGKTALINEFVQRQACKCISFTAVELSENDLLSIMTETVLNELDPSLIGEMQFPSFEKLFEYIGMRAEKERIIFVIDEYPYLAKQCPYIQSVLQKVIDHTWQKTNLFFLICGSLIAFMKDEVLASSAPLHGRCNVELKLQPFNYLDTAAFVDNYSYEEKAIVYGLTNGVAKYVEQFNPQKPLYENIIEQFFEFGGYFTEEQIKTVITSEKQSPTLYNSIVSAIASGHTKNSEIATKVGMDDLSYPLKGLVKAEIIEKKYSKRPYYVLNDTMLSFWFKYVSRAISLINAGHGRQFFETQICPKLHDFMGRVFEKICREYLFLKAGSDDFPLVTEIENFQKSVLDPHGNPIQIELDLVGKNLNDLLLVAECKFQNQKVDLDLIKLLQEKVSYINSKKLCLCIFSLSGFTDEAMAHAKDSGVKLISIEELYRQAG